MTDTSTKKNVDSATALLFILVFLNFTPLYVFMPLGRALINYVYPFVIMSLALLYLKGYRFKSKAILFLSLIFLYMCMTVILNSLFGTVHRSQEIFLDGSRMILYFLLIIYVCNSEKKLVLFVKYFIIMTGVSAVFGMLVYFFGEPFTTIKFWLNQIRDGISRGSQLGGIYSLPHLFGYLLASTPILCFTVYLYEHKKKWLLLYLILIFGLFLNAERSAFAMNILGIILLIFFGNKENRRRGLAMLLAGSLFFLVAYYFVQYVGKPDAALESTHRAGTLAERTGESSLGGVISRLEYQLHGIRAVLKSPIKGVSGSQYSGEVLSIDKFTFVYDQKIMYPHNHYIIAGMRAGVLGWLILLANVLILLRTQHTINQSALMTRKFAVISKGLSLSVMAVMGNAVFHNAGLFTFEFATITTIAMFFSQLGFMQTENPTSAGNV